MRRALSLMASAALVLGLAASCSSSDPAVDTGSSTPAPSTPGSTPGTAVTGGSSMTTTPAPPTAASLEGQTYVSASVTGHELVTGTQITLVFTGTNVSATAGCNTLGGTYTIQGSTLTVDEQVTSTMMACPTELADQDTWLTGWLTGGLTIGATADGISLEGGGTTVELAAQATTGSGTGTQALTGVTWTLTSIENGDAVSSLPSGVEAPTLVFADDGTVAVFSGCNRGSTTYEVGDDGFITFGPLASTMMACEPAATAVETTVISVLTGRVAFGFEASDLSISNQGQRLLYEAS